MANKLNERDGSRTTSGKTFNMVRRHNKPPADQNGWCWLTRDLLESYAFSTLSGNALRALFRISIEHISQGGLRNGLLIVTHRQFVTFGVTGEYVADAIDELKFKGLIGICRGRAGLGTSHPNIFRLTFYGDLEGARPTNEWKRFTIEQAKAWSESVRKQKAAARRNMGRKKNSPLRDSEVSPLVDSEIRRSA